MKFEFIAFLALFSTLLVAGCVEGDSYPQISSFQVDERIPLNSAISVLVSASDDNSLVSISASVDGEEKVFDCAGEQSCSNTFVFEGIGLGSHTVEAVALDSLNQKASLSKEIEVYELEKGEALQKVFEDYGFFGAENIGESSSDFSLFNRTNVSWLKLKVYMLGSEGVFSGDSFDWKKAKEPAISWSGRKALIVLSPSKEDANSSNLEKWKEFVKVVVERYSQDPYNAELYQLIENPEYSSEWKDSAEGYAVLLRSTYEAVKEADSGAFVVLGNYVQESGKTLDFHKDVLNYSFSDGRKGSDFFNVFAVAYYDSIALFEKRWKEIDSQVSSIVLEKPLVLLSTASKSSSFDDASYASDIVKRLVTARALNVPIASWFTFKDSFSPAKEEEMLKNSGILSNQGGTKQSYHTFSYLTSNLSDINSSRTIALSKGDDSIYAYKFFKPSGESITFVWNSSTFYKKYSFATDALEVEVTDLVPDTYGEFSKTTYKAADGFAVIDVRFNPVSVVEK